MALEGWRREVFGQHAIDLMEGRLALTYRKGGIAWLHADTTAEGAVSAGAAQEPV
jgi:hypothetical protein